MVSGTRKGVDATKAPISNANTAFGAVGISGHEDLAGDGRAFAARVTETIVAIDQQIAASFTQAQIDAAKAALEGTMSHSPEFGGDASMNAEQAVAVALKQRYVLLFSAVDQSMAQQIAAAANSTEAVGAAIQNSATQLALRTQITAMQSQLGGLLEQSLAAPETKTLAARLKDANKAIADIALAYNGSIESLQLFAAAVQARTALALEYLQQITAVDSQIKQYTTGGRAKAVPTLNLSEQLAGSATKVREYTAALDTSVESHQRLLDAVNERYALEVQYLTQIKALSEDIKTMLRSTAESIKMTFYTPQQNYDYYKQQANTAIAQIATATTPEQVQALINTVNSATNQAWSTLGQDPDEQRAKQAEFLEFLKDAEELARSRLVEIEAVAQVESDALRANVADTMITVGQQVSDLANAVAELKQAAEMLASTSTVTSQSAATNQAAAQTFNGGVEAFSLIFERFQTINGGAEAGYGYA